MFGSNNISRRIRILADVIFWLDLISAVTFAYYHVYISRFNVISIIIGILVILISVILGWLLSSVLYGLSQIVDNTDRLSESVDRLADSIDILVSAHLEKQRYEIQQQESMRRNAYQQPLYPPHSGRQNRDS